ncbi:unnamed protein product [Heligmosomoides polygyrus]|uniref:Uncharacterized protein n=1 Tax=Heligmosomoides polygyrus TaxID=6339 RepID=A0A183GWH7_HELPZ|nr:unnamed protein product [Heligmosomoides polygyrus]
MWSGVILLKDNATPGELLQPILADCSLYAVTLRRVNFGINAGTTLDESKGSAFLTPPNGEHHLPLVRSDLGVGPGFCFGLSHWVER